MSVPSTASSHLRQQKHHKGYSKSSGVAVRVQGLGLKREGATGEGCQNDIGFGLTLELGKILQVTLRGHPWNDAISANIAASRSLTHLRFLMSGRNRRA